MKKLLAGLTLSLCLVSLSAADPQRSRGSASRPAQSSSRPAPSRPTASPRPSTPSRPTASPRPSPAPAPRPSARPSTPSRSTTGSVPSRSVIGTRGAASAPSSRPSTPDRAVGSLPGTSSGSSAGASLYGGRGQPLPGPSITTPSTTPTDSAPGLSEVGGVGNPTAGALGGAFSPYESRPSSRVRFPTPYSPTATPGPTTGSIFGSLPPRETTSGAPSLPGLSLVPTVGGPRTGPAIGYDRGPLRRKDAPSAVRPTPVRPTSSSPVKPTQPSAGRPTGTTSAGKVDGIGWRKLSRLDPGQARRVGAVTQAAGAAHDGAVGAAVSIFGGVAPGSWRGRHSPTSYGGYYNDPWGSHCGWWLGGTFSSSWCWSWNWAVCWGLYYPCWWWTTRPYYSSYYCYYPAVATTIVYPTETRIVYADSVVYAEGAQLAQGTPVGEAAVLGAPAGSPLTIVAQRYLELGDRAFREGRYTDSVQFYAKAVEFAPDQGGLYLVLSDALFAAGDYHYGAYAIRRALELDPGLVETQVDKHAFYPQPEIFDQQLATLERYVAEHPSDRDARLVLALNYLFAARAAEAASVLDAPASLRSGDQAALLIQERSRGLSPIVPR